MRQAAQSPGAGSAAIALEHAELGSRWLYCAGAPDLLYTENETNTARVFGHANGARYFKDGIHEAVVNGLRGSRQPRADRLARRRALPAHGTRGELDDRRCCASATKVPMSLGRSVRGRECDCRAAAAGSRRILRHRDPGRSEPGRACRHAPGAWRPALVQAVLSLHRAGLAEGRPLAAAASRLTSERPELGMAAAVQR